MTVMAKKAAETRVTVVEGPLDPGRPTKPKFRMVERDGTRIRLRVVDADSPHFTADLHASFAASVRRARRENRALGDD
jgi:hypothetical protein